MVTTDHTLTPAIALLDPRLLTPSCILSTCYRDFFPGVIVVVAVVFIAAIVVGMYRCITQDLSALVWLSLPDDAANSSKYFTAACCSYKFYPWPGVECLLCHHSLSRLVCTVATGPEHDYLAT